jgi:predicted ATPase
MQPDVILTPAQQAAANYLSEKARAARVLLLRGAAGSGKTTILEALRASRGGVLLRARQFMEETYLHLLEEAVQTRAFVLADDLHLIAKLARTRGAARAHLFDAALTAILADARVLSCTLVFAVEAQAPRPVEQRAGGCFTIAAAKAMCVG